MVSTRAGSCSEVALPSSARHAAGPIAAVAAPAPRTPAQQRVFLLDLPVELLDKIFSYVGYKKVAQVRVVSRQMNQVCSLLLNSTFQRLQNQIMVRFQNVKAKMPRRESARRNHPLACECDIIETCHMRLSLLQMTFGKHIERKHCCFFPGGILDEVLNVLHHVRSTQVLGRPYKVTDELFDLSTMAMEYFKEHIEPGLPDLVYFSKSFLDFTSTANANFLDPPSTSSRDNSFSTTQPSPPHMVLRKGIRKIKQGMKKYNNQLTVLRNELRSCKKKATEQSKLIAEQQKLIADQQKQTLDYATRLDENDKKNEEMSRKFSTLLQELNKCKTELQYWRSTPSAASVAMAGDISLAIGLPSGGDTIVDTVQLGHSVGPEQLEAASSVLFPVAIGRPLLQQAVVGPSVMCGPPKRRVVVVPEGGENSCSNSTGPEEGSVNSSKKARRSVKNGTTGSSKAP